jgi:hypothetical protein
VGTMPAASPGAAVAWGADGSGARDQRRQRVSDATRIRRSRLSAALRSRAIRAERLVKQFM